MVNICYRIRMTAQDGLNRVREDFGKQGAMTLLGASIVHLAPGEVDLALPYRDAVGQHHGFFHGGVLAALLDTACGLAALSLMAAGQGVVSAEFKLNFLAPARGERVVAQGRVVKAGRLLSVCVGNAHVDGTRHVALMQATMCTVPQP